MEILINITKGIAYFLITISIVSIVAILVAAAITMWKDILNEWF